MKIYLALLIFLAPVLAFAKGTPLTFSGGAPLPIAFSYTDTQSRVQECQGNVIEIFNQTAAALAYGFGTATAIPLFDFAYVPPGPAGGTRIRLKSGPGQYLYLRTASGSPLTSLTVQAACFYEEK